MVTAVQGICLSGLRIVAPDPAARLGAVGDHHVPGLGDSHRIPDVQTGAAYRPERALMHRGEKVYADSCAVCHGDKLQGNPTAGIGGDKLIGGRGTLASAAPVKTVESYWPYATTLFDYVKRSMPFTTPGSLSDEQVYSVVAYILGEANIVPKNAVLDAKSLPDVQMPNCDGFVSDPRPEIELYR